MCSHTWCKCYGQDMYISSMTALSWQRQHQWMQPFRLPSNHTEVCGCGNTLRLTTMTSLGLQKHCSNMVPSSRSLSLTDLTTKTWCLQYLEQDRYCTVFLIQGSRSQESRSTIPGRTDWYDCTKCVSLCHWGRPLQPDCLSHTCLVWLQRCSVCHQTLSEMNIYWHKTCWRILSPVWHAPQKRQNILNISMFWLTRTMSVYGSVYPFIPNWIASAIHWLKLLRVADTSQLPLKQANKPCLFEKVAIYVWKNFTTIHVVTFMVVTTMRQTTPKNSWS